MIIDNKMRNETPDRELVSNNYKLRDAALIAASWQPYTSWGNVNQDFYFESAEAARDKILSDSTIELFSTVGGETLTAHPDDMAIDLFSDAMKAKMKYSREVKGRHGWDDASICSLDDLRRMFEEHVEKGDLVDIANFAMMIWNRIYRLDAERSKVEG